MIVYLGAAAHLTFNLVDPDSGAPRDGDNVTLTVLLPDGTPSDQSLLIVHDDVGKYHADFPTTVPGRHIVRWHSDPDTPAALEDVFNVSGQWSRALIGVAEAKAHMQKSSAVTVDDDEVRRMIVAVTPLVELKCGPIAADLADRDEWHDGGAQTIALLYRPVLSVTSVTEAYGANVVHTLGEQILDGSGAVDAFGYSIDKDSGILTRRVSGMVGPFAAGRRNVHVLYKAGRAVVPENIQTAVQIVVAHLWETQRGKTGGRGQSANSELIQVPGIGYLVPRRAIELLEADPYAGNYGIA